MSDGYMFEMLLMLLVMLNSKATNPRQLRVQLTRAGNIIITFKLTTKD